MPFIDLPLGQRIPSSPHAVSCSLPRMRDVRGYEEKNPDTMRQVQTAYPRFVVNPFIRRLAEHFKSVRPAWSDRALWLTSSATTAEALRAQLARQGWAAESFAVDGINGVTHAAAANDTALAAKLYLQNIGGFLSSREAEDHLVRLGLVAAPHPEPTFAGDGATAIREALRSAYPECRNDDLLLANSGMNAVYAAFRAASEIQAARGRTVWLQLGWLYGDSIAVLKKFTATPADYVYVRDPTDTDAIARILDRFGPRIAGILSEVPTNPLIQTPDVPALADLCQRHGVHLILDPSIASPFSVDVLKYSDLSVCSLTKYTASEGDLIVGSVAVNPAGRDAAELRRRVAALLDPVYPRDVARLAVEIAETGAVLAQIEANAFRVVAYLEHHPRIRDVYWALSPASRDNFRRIARRPDATGGVISFTLRTGMEAFYDRLRLPKGPSFGMKTTLICPFLYLAHYDLVTTPAGVAELAASRIDPDLLRLCVGVEPADEIIAVIDEALGGK